MLSYTQKQSLYLIRRHLKQIDYLPASGKNWYFIKVHNSHIQLNIYRDEFPQGIDGKKWMDSMIENIHKYVEIYHPLISICANIVYRSKKNMKNLEDYP